ncbi:metallophosphoesterase family protein [Nocardia takedensis]
MQRSVIVGDIHGCFDELTELLDRVGVTDEDQVISVGDLVDRGPKPAEVVRLFRERPNSVVVAGNHERKHARGLFSYAQEVTRLQLGDGYSAMVEWMRTLPYYFENAHVRVVHAGMVPGLALAAQREDVLCGSTRGERELRAAFPDGHWHDHYTDAIPIAFGHHVVGPEPMVRDHRVYGLDTGACHGGSLTALCLPDATLYSVRAHADHWARVRREWQVPVLRTRPWADYTWAEIGEKTADFRSGSTDPELGEWLTAMDAWTARLRASFDVVLDTARHTAAGLDGERLRRHPAARFLFQVRAGRLDHAALTRQCTTPARILRLAAALEIDLPADVPAASARASRTGAASTTFPGA